MPTSVQMRSTTDGLFAASVHPSGRYFVDQYGNPMLMAGASEQAWLNIGVSDINLVMATRAAQGFNFEMLLLIAGGLNSPDMGTFDGIPPFFKSDGVTPGTGPADYDVTKPFPDYWARVDAVFAAAAANGITLFVCIADTYLQSTYGFYANQGSTKMAAYSTFVANRYKGYTYHYNWAFDHFTTNPGGWAATDPTITAMMNAAKVANPRAAHTIENNDSVWTTGATSGAALNLPTDDPSWSLGSGSGQMNLNWWYTGEDNGPDCLRAYNLTPAAPVFFAEGVYDGTAGSYPSVKNTWSNLLNRKYLWYPMVNGACGSNYGHITTWGFFSGWQAVLATTPVAHAVIWRRFMTSVNWWTLVPDQTHVFVTAGYPTAGFPYPTRFGVNAAAAADGTLGLVYLSAGGSVTVDLTKMATWVVARWFDPTNATFTPIGTFANTGTHVFTRSTNNVGGDPDWVLVLTV